MEGNGIFLGGSLLAATIAGSIALFAPCCISVMLPAYFATSFQNRRVLIAMTFLFAAGIASVILPIAMGAQALQRMFTADHTVVFLTGGLLMLALGLYSLLGGEIHLPMPGRTSTRVGPLGVYSLGVFSGIASSCCAPVLAGVIALSGVAGSFALALGLGAAYVFGMVTPLFLISVLWDRFDWRASRLFKPRIFALRLGALHRSVSGTSLATGILLLLMGAGTVWVALARDAMPGGTGWQAEVSSQLQHYGHVVTTGLSFLPEWLVTAVLFAAVLLLGGKAIRQMRASPETEESDRELETEENLVDQQSA